MAICEATAAGCMFGRFSVPVPSRICFTPSTSVARNMEQEGLAILAQRLAPVLVDRVQGHGEEAEFHLRHLSSSITAVVLAPTQHLTAYKPRQTSYVVVGGIVICNARPLPPAESPAALREKAPCPSP